MSGRGLFVTGTDTGVGKTLVCCALLRALRGRGIDIVGMKAVETGVGPEGPLDAAALAAAAGGLEPLSEICPQRFGLPAAPAVAAAREQTRVDGMAVREAYVRLASRHAAVVVEGAGGLLVPLDESDTMSDLAHALGLPLLIVARATLGTINHCGLTLEVARARGHRVAGVVISHADGELSAADAANLGYLREQLGELLLGELPPLAEGEEPADDAIRLAPLLELLS
jgi:dethiobiotin synthetase